MAASHLSREPIALAQAGSEPITSTGEMVGMGTGYSHSSLTVHGPDDVEACRHKVPVIPSRVAELRSATGALDDLHF